MSKNSLGTGVRPRGSGELPTIAWGSDQTTGANTSGPGPVQTTPQRARMGMGSFGSTATEPEKPEKELGHGKTTSTAADGKTMSLRWVDTGCMISCAAKRGVGKTGENLAWGI